MHNSFQVSNDYKINEPLLYSYLPEEEAVKVNSIKPQRNFLPPLLGTNDDKRDALENNEEEVSEQDEGKVVLDEASLVVSQSH